MTRSKIITSASLLVLLRSHLASPATENDGGRRTSHSFPVRHPIHARTKARLPGRGIVVVDDGNEDEAAPRDRDRDGIYESGGGNARRRRLRGRPKKPSAPSESETNSPPPRDRTRRENDERRGAGPPDEDYYRPTRNDDNEDVRRRTTRRLNTMVSEAYLSVNRWYPSHDDLRCLDDGNVPQYMTWQGGYAEAHLFDDRAACCRRWFPEIDGCFDAVVSGGGNGSDVGGGGPGGDKSGSYSSNAQQVTDTLNWQEQEQEQIAADWDAQSRVNGGGKVGPSVEYAQTGGHDGGGGGGPGGDKSGSYSINVQQVTDTLNWQEQEQEREQEQGAADWDAQDRVNDGGKVGPSVEYASNANNHGDHRPSPTSTGDKHGSVNSLAAATLPETTGLHGDADIGRDESTTMTTPVYNGRGHGAPVDSDDRVGDRPSNNIEDPAAERTFPTSSCGAGWSHASQCDILCLSGSGCPPGQQCHPGVSCPATQVAAAMGNAGAGILGLISGGAGGGAYAMGIPTNVCGEDYPDAERRCRAGDVPDDGLSSEPSLGFADDFLECPSGAGCPGGMHCYGEILCPLPPTISPAPTRSPVVDYAIEHSAERGGHGKSIVAYYAAWQYYDRDKLAQPRNLNYDMVTRINYAFFQTDANGNIWGTDEFADGTILFGDVVEARTGMVCNRNVADSSGGSEGCRCLDVGRDRKSCNFHDPDSGLIHLAHRNGVEVYPSIGGWTLSEAFPVLAASQRGREKFAQSCIEMMLNYDFDGVDVDWEYPGYAPHGGTAEDGDNFVLLLRTVRSALDALGGQVGRRYGLTAALPCGPENIAHQNLAEVAEALDELNLMTYDFHGAWDVVTGHNAPLFDQPRDFEAGWSVDGCVGNWAGAIAEEHRSKVNIGLPFYGRSYLDTTELYDVHGGSDVYSWYDDDGTPQYFNILSKSEEMTSVRDDETKTQYAYFNDGYGMVSYDDERSICDKVGYALDNGLGGFIIWEISGDMMDDFHQPLLEAVNRKLALPDINCKASFGISAAVQNDVPAVEATESANDTEPVVATDPMDEQAAVKEERISEEPILRGDKTEVVGLPVAAPPPAPRPIPSSSAKSPYTLSKSSFGPLSAAADTCAGGCPPASSCVGNSAGGNLIKDEECAACSTGQTWWPCDVDGLCWCWADGTDRIAPALASGVKEHKGGGKHYTVCDDVLTRAMFDEIAPEAREPYSYEGLCDAILSYNAQHSEEAFGMGDAYVRTAELAAFLGNTLHESDEFRAGREYLMCADNRVVGGEVYCKPCDPGSFDWAAKRCNRSLITGTSDFNEYCQPQSRPPEACECGRGQGEGGDLEGYVRASHLFFGRGAIQLSWNYNYYGASVALTGSGSTFCDDPDLVSTEGRYAWGAGLYFWMEHAKEGTTAHVEATREDGGNFGGTLNNINGGLECPAHGGWHVDAVKARLDRYCRAARALGLPNLLRLDGCAGLPEAMNACLAEGKCDHCRHYAGKATGKHVSNFVPAVAAPATTVTEPRVPPPCGEGLMPWEWSSDCCVPNSAFIGDGACDPDAPYNTAACGYDGGDCCKDTCDYTSAFGCATKEGSSFGSYGPFGFYCIDPAARLTPMSSVIDEVLCDVDEKYRIGDGRCNPAYNTPACGYDGGDCCEETCDGRFSFYPCGSGVRSFVCLDPRFAAEEDTDATATDLPTISPTERPASKAPTNAPTRPPTPPTRRPVESYSESLLASMCPMDMMECPDGKYMSRNPDRGCAFDPCAVEAPQEQSAPVVVVEVCEFSKMECRGGTYVGRDPNDGCNYFPCPDTTEVVPPVIIDEPKAPEPTESLQSKPTNRPSVAENQKLPKCKQDLLECPGTGKYVGRNPHNNCEYLACPAADEPKPKDSLATSISSAFGQDAPLPPPPSPSEEVDRGGCNDQVRRCPGGGFVGKDPENHCEFFACSSVAASMSSSFGQNAPPPRDDNDDRGGAGCNDQVLRCPDGSFVGKNPENGCEYFACPSLATLISSSFGQNAPPSPANDRGGCDDRVFRCPDGSFVGKNPENGCNYFACPSLATLMSSSLGQDAPSPPANDDRSQCTDEIVRCPDGSFVGKDPESHCEYFACATEGPSPRPTPNPTDRIVSMAGSVHSKHNARVKCSKELHACADGHYVGQDPDNGCRYYPCSAANGQPGRPTQRTTDNSSTPNVQTKRPTQRTPDISSTANGQPGRPTQQTTDNSSTANGETKRPTQPTPDISSTANGQPGRPAQQTTDNSSTANGQTKRPTQPTSDNSLNASPSSGCDKDLYACSDGTYVGRNPVKNCTFFQCPNSDVGEDMNQMTKAIGGAYPVAGTGGGQMHRHKKKNRSRGRGR